MTCRQVEAWFGQKHNNVLRILVSPSRTSTPERAHRGPLRAWEKAANPTFSMPSCIANELSALRRPWCNLSRGSPSLRSCAGVFRATGIESRWWFHHSSRFCFAHFLIIFSRESCARPALCVGSTSFRSLSLLFLGPSVFNWHWSSSWLTFSSPFATKFSSYLAFASLMISLHLGGSLGLSTAWSRLLEGEIEEVCGEFGI